MLKKFTLFSLGLAFVGNMAMAQTVQFCGVKNTMRYDDGDDTKYTYIGWNSETQKAEFTGDVGLWSIDMNGNKLQSNLVHYDNLMYGNSGAIYIDGYIYTVMSHEDPDGETSEDVEFVVRKWDAKTYELLSSQRFPKSANIESRGMSYNSVDGKVYGLFYLTDVMLPVGVEELDPEDVQEGLTTDAGYALCTIDLNTMEISQITPGIYYDNFVTLACSPEGRIYSMTSGGVMVEFDRNTGIIKSKKIINEYNEEEDVYYYNPSGQESQFKRQSACFDFNTGKMYWNGYVNSGKGINDWGSWSTLSDKEWRTNGKYDTALYEVDITTGGVTKIANIPNRIAFSCLWVVGGDGTQGAGINEVATSQNDAPAEFYDATGMRMSKVKNHGVYIVKQGNTVKKVRM